MAAPGLWWTVVCMALTCNFLQVTSAAEIDDIRKLADINTDFGLRLYNLIKSQNIFLSPYSITMALAMTYSGAAEDTKTEMAEVLGFDAMDDNLDLNHVFKSLTSMVVEKSGDVTLKEANKLFGQDGKEFLEAFLDALQAYYNAPLEQLNFGLKPKESRSHINNWVSEKTEGIIKELLQPGQINSGTVLVLVNAIYFKGNWKDTFNASLTSEGKFTIDSDNEVNVLMMHRSGEYPYAFSSELSCDVLELPYKGDDVSMYILLPEDKDGLAKVESTLTVEIINMIVERVALMEVEVTLPKFIITERPELVKLLKEMGMTKAFGLEADFSGMDGSKGLSIDDVVHEAFVEVNEEGTEAAASTAVTMSRSGPTTFTADRPFMFFIREKSTGSVLFVGRLATPQGTMYSARNVRIGANTKAPDASDGASVSQMVMLPVLLSTIIMISLL